MSWLPFWTYQVDFWALACVSVSAVLGWTVAIIQTVRLHRSEDRR